MAGNPKNLKKVQKLVQKQGFYRKIGQKMFFFQFFTNK
jgi:hypothetical protein